jgi:hypothetical protein
MRKLYYLVRAAAIATMVAAFAAPANAQPFSSVMGSWGYGGYGAFHMVLWVFILIAFAMNNGYRIFPGLCWLHQLSSDKRLYSASTTSLP